MNESEFESELRALRPAPPSPALERRIAAEMPASRAITVVAPRAVAHAPAAGVVGQSRRPSPISGLLRSLLWASAGAAAAALVLLSRNPQAPAPQQPARIADTAQTSETLSELIGTADDGLVFDTDSAEPQRQMRFSYLDRVVWTNPQTGAVIEFEVPREDIVLMPVAMQ